jgi:hypothetical protein
VRYEIAYVVIYIAMFRENLLAVTTQQILAEVSSESLIYLTTELHCVTFLITSQVLYFFLHDQTSELFRNCYSKPRYSGAPACDSIEGGSYWSSVYSLTSTQIDMFAILYFLR